MECEFKFIQQWRAKLLFHIEQQLNISKTLRSTFPNHGIMTSVFLYQESAFMNQPVLFVCRKMKENDKVSRAKNPKYESMSLEELKANMEKSRQELEAAIHHKNLLEQRKKLVERRERSHRLIVKGAEFEKAFPLSRDLEQEEFQEVMNQMRNSSYNKSVVRQTYISAS